MEQELLPVNDGTILINSGTHGHFSSQQHSFEVSRSWKPIAVSTHIMPTVPRSQKDIENELFDDIEQLVRKFIRRPNLDYPYYRVIRCIEGDDSKLEHFITVVINRPSVVTERHQ